MGIEFDKVAEQAKLIFWDSDGSPEVSDDGIIGYCGAYEASIQAVNQLETVELADMVMEIINEDIDRGVDLSAISSYDHGMNTAKILGWICSDVLRDALLQDKELSKEDNSRYEQFSDFEANRFRK